MGWVGGDLKPLAVWILLLLVPFPAAAQEPAAPTSEELSAEERGLLEILELLEELELLESWDPGEGLPIPVAPAPLEDGP